MSISDFIGRVFNDLKITKLGRVYEDVVILHLAVTVVRAGGGERVRYTVTTLFELLNYISFNELI